MRPYRNGSHGVQPVGMDRMNVIAGLHCARFCSHVRQNVGNQTTFRPRSGERGYDSLFSGYPRPCEVRARNARGGVSLVEMLIVITLMSTLSLLAVGAIITLMRAEVKGTRSLVASTTTSRLSRDFRDDVHAAREAKLENAGDQPRLVLIQNENACVTYEARNDAVARTSHDGDQVTSRETYRLPATSVRWELAETGTPAALVIDTPVATASSGDAGTSEGRSSRSLRIEAAVGLDHRFQKEPQ